MLGLAWLDPSITSHLPMKMEQIDCSETSAYINQTPGNHPKEKKQQPSNVLAITNNINGHFTVNRLFAADARLASITVCTVFLSRV